MKKREQIEIKIYETIGIKKILKNYIQNKRCNI